MSECLVDYRVEKGVAILEFNNAPANSINYEFSRDLDQAILSARMDEAVHVLVLRGSGEKFFSAGADIQMLSEVTDRFKYFFFLHASETLQRLEQTPKLVIAALNGHTVGGGLEIALAADIRIAKRDGGKIGMPEVTFGALPAIGGAQRLSRIVGKSRAIQLLAEGSLFEFDEAEQLGIVNYVWDAETNEVKWWDRVIGYARGFCPPNRPPGAVGRIKRAIQAGWDMPLDAAIAVEQEMQQQLLATDDAKEGLGAYNEDRKPEFSGT